MSYAFNYTLQCTEHSLSINVTSEHLHSSQCVDYIYDGEISSIADTLQNEANIFGIKLVTSKHIGLLLSNNCIAYNNETPVPRFVNLVNTYYLDSVLQIIMHTSLFYNYFLFHKHVCQKESN